MALCSEAPPLYAKGALSQEVPRACELRGSQDAKSFVFERMRAGDEPGYWTPALGALLEDVRRSEPSRCAHRSPYYIHKADKSRQWRLRKSSGPGVEDQPGSSLYGQTYIPLGWWPS